MYPLKWDNYGTQNSTIELYRAILLNEFKMVIFNIIKKTNLIFQI